MVDVTPNASVSAPKYHLEGLFDPQQAQPDDAHSILMRLIPPNSRVLELGCASGYLGGYMEQQLGCRVTGLEFDAEAARIAATRMSEVHVVNLDADRALAVAQASAPYDLVLAAAVLEHLQHPDRVLDQIKSLLAPNGTLIVSLPNIAHWGVRLQLLLGRFDYSDYGIMDRTHVHFYTVRTGARLLEDQGFTVKALHIAGSGLQNMVNRLARANGRPLPQPIMPGLFAYELIYVAHMRA